MAHRGLVLADEEEENFDGDLDPDVMNGSEALSDGSNKSVEDLVTFDMQSEPQVEEEIRIDPFFVPEALELPPSLSVSQSLVDEPGFVSSSKRFSESDDCPLLSLDLNPYVVLEVNIRYLVTPYQHFQPKAAETTE